MLVSRCIPSFEKFGYKRTRVKPHEDSGVYGPDSHQKFEMIYLVEGEVKYTIEDEQYLVKAGDVIFIMPNEMHMMEENRDIYFERILIYFNYELLREMFGIAQIAIEDTFFDLSKVNRIIPERLVKKYGIKDVIFEIAEISDGDKNSCFKFFSKIFDMIVRLSESAADSGEMILPISKDPTIKGIIDYVEQHISEPITLDGLAKDLYISKSTLCHKFANHMNITINRYIAIKKVHYAAELIKGGMSATEAAMAAGYNHYTTFYHNYKQIMGFPPSSGERAR